MKEFLILIGLMLLVFSRPILGVLVNKAEHSVQKKMDKRAQKKENKEHMNTKEDN